MMTQRDRDTRADIIERAAEDADSPPAIAAILLGAAIAMLGDAMGEMEAARVLRGTLDDLLARVEN